MGDPGAAGNPSIADIITSLQSILGQLESGAPLTDAQRAQLTTLLAELIADLQGVQSGVDSLMHGS
jgi:hypothetical protein